MAKRLKKPRKVWMYVPPKPPKPKVPDDLKAEVTAKANTLIEAWKPLYLKKPPKGYKFNYIVDLYTKWFRSYFYFCAKKIASGTRVLYSSGKEGGGL